MSVARAGGAEHAAQCCRGGTVAHARTPIDRSRPRLCVACGASVAAGARVCAACGSTRLAPPWVVATRAVGRGFTARITESSPAYGAPHRRISLSRWSPGLGARATVNLNAPGELHKLMDACDEFARTLGWTRTEVAPVRGGGTTAQSIAQLPDRPASARAIGTLLERWTLEQIGELALEVRRRLDAIALLERIAADERTYELRSDTSIHRVLEQALWLVDERYLLLTSNVSLRALIGTKLRGKTRLRPDFTCAMSATEGVIIELKRPSHALTVEDANQVERYLVLAEAHARRTRWRALLIGGRVGRELRRTAPHRPAVEIRTFADLVADARRRYREYLRIVEPGTAAASLRTDMPGGRGRV